MSVRKSTPRGQMTRGANSGPAVMLMPPHIRATFMPNPPLRHIPPVKYRRKNAWSGAAAYLVHLEKETPQKSESLTPREIRESRRRLKQERHEKELEPMIDEYRQKQKEASGEFQGMNCYNTLFVGRLAYEVTERKLLREMEAFGSIKDIRIIKHDDKSRYAFIEYEHEEDMKRAYRAADGMRIEGRDIVVDVERGHTVPTWLPRRLGGGLGGTRLGGKDENVIRPGRFDPSRPEASVPGPPMGPGVGPPPGAAPPYGYGPPPIGPPPYGRGRGPDRYGGPPPHDWERGSGGAPGWGRGKRSRSRSPDRRSSRRRW